MIFKSTIIAAHQKTTRIRHQNIIEKKTERKHCLFEKMLLILKLDKKAKK